MASVPCELDEVSWRVEPQHDPTDALREFVALRDGLCDGPTGARVAARRAGAAGVRRRDRFQRPRPATQPCDWSSVAGRPRSTSS